MTKPAALLTLPDISWFNPSGIEISGQVNSTQIGSTAFVSVKVTLSPLLASYSGYYTCQVSVMSPSLLAPLNLTSTTRVSIQSKSNEHGDNYYHAVFLLQFHHLELR